MYKVLRQYRKQLIVLDEVTAKIPIDTNSVPTRILEESIQIAEERLKSEICTSFYEDLRNRKNVIVTSVNKSYLESLFTGSVTLTIGEIVNAIELVDDSDYVKFWHEHLQKTLAEMTMYVASPVNYSRFKSEGEMENNPRVITGEGSGSASVELATMKWKLDRMYMDRIAPLLAGVNEYLYNHRSLFPLVNCKKWNYVDTPNGVAVARKTAWVTGLYDTNKNVNCNTCRDRDGY